MSSQPVTMMKMTADQRQLLRLLVLYQQRAQPQVDQRQQQRRAN
jgi:hypothetical protein